MTQQARLPALPGEKVMTYIPIVGLLAGELQSLNYETYEATIEVARHPLGSITRTSDISDVIPTELYSYLLRQGWKADQYYKLKSPTNEDLLSFAEAANWCHTNNVLTFGYFCSKLDSYSRNALAGEHEDNIWEDVILGTTVANEGFGAIDEDGCSDDGTIIKFHGGQTIRWTQEDNEWF